MERQEIKEIKQDRRNEKKKEILTGKELKDARDGEPLSFAEGEELRHEHEDAQDGEYASEHGAGLHCLEVICRGSQREGDTVKRTRAGRAGMCVMLNMC